ncbi:MAG: aminoglycoside phosphotransferase family protein [Burkholderiales bacterium]|nr:aminoglycoside phosphotransferase family protein [Burkholderiales bacterium]
MKLPEEIESAVESLMEPHGGIGGVEFLALPRLVPDHVEKAVVFTPEARPALLVMIAPAAYPDCVRDAFGRAEAARLALGGTIGEAVQVALCKGFAASQSFAVVPYLRPRGSGRLRQRWERLRLRGPVLAWLREATRRTVSVPPEGALADGFVEPLRALCAHAAVGEQVRSAARASLGALEAGRWQPRWVLAHNDLWIGNLLRRPSVRDGAPAFAVIDWGGSRVRGYPMYDLLTMATSIRLPTASLRRELRQHSALLGCEPAHAKDHLLAALGALALDLGEWPVERFAATARQFVSLMDEAG